MQRPVYYISQAFQGIEAKYPWIEKMAFSLIVASRKLLPYFQAHTIIVIMDQPIRKTMSKLDVAGHMIQWAIELSQFDIEYRPRTTIKAQAFADFIAKFTLPDIDQEVEYWTISTDGLSIVGLGGVDVIKTTPEKDILKYGVQLQFPVTNNEAKYEAIHISLTICKSHGDQEFEIENWF